MLFSRENVTKNVKITYILAGCKIVPLRWESDSRVRESEMKNKIKCISVKSKWKGIRQNGVLKIVEGK